MGHPERLGVVDRQLHEIDNKSKYVAGGFWTVILTRSAWARSWASVWPRSKRVVADEVCALNKWYGASPACDSLDHRAGAC